MLKIPTPILKFQAFAHINFSSSTIHVEHHFIIETGISVKHHLIFGVSSLTDLYITSYLQKGFFFQKVTPNFFYISDIKVQKLKLFVF